MIKRFYYSDSILEFLKKDESAILGELVANSDFSTEHDQRDAWIYQVRFLKSTLAERSGFIFFEYSIPRMGKRIDAVVIDRHIIFVIEFKVGESDYKRADIDQVWDYGLDLKNFHETSHQHFVAPVLIATKGTTGTDKTGLKLNGDRLFEPVLANAENFANVYKFILDSVEGEAVNNQTWGAGSYSPTPTIIEAATALYSQHSVENISRSDDSAKNLKVTGNAVSNIIASCREQGEKAICFVTGVPGAGKTLVGLDVATKYLDASGADRSVFLSGNGPLVAILTEALARDAIARAKQNGTRLKKGDARSKVKVFLQNVHHYRDEYLRDEKPPIDHVAIFDEAQRA
ncbi:MAG: DUF2075 domain-containing protein [Pyrinomonadaceae bacterium]